MSDRHKRLSDEKAPGARRAVPSGEATSASESDESSVARDQRRYQVSSNRSTATHKVRYVESGGGESNDNCRVCKPTPKSR